jgi:hypothetical protein
MQDYQTLIAEHDHMTLLAGDLARAVEDGQHVDRAIGMRARLSVAVESHLRREESFLLAELRAPGNGVFPAAVAKFRQSSTDLTEAWSCYMRGWDVERIAADWAGFAAQTIALMARLRERIAQENRLLYPIALQGCRIRLRAAA